MRLTSEELDAIQAMLPPREHRRYVFVDIEPRGMHVDSNTFAPRPYLHVAVVDRETKERLREARVLADGEVVPV